MRISITVHQLPPPLTRAGELMLRLEVEGQVVVLPIQADEEVPFDISDDHQTITPYPDIPREDD